MKLVIASDIHGSARWCRALLDLVEKEQPQKLILLGDLLYHGPRNDLPEGYAPKQVIPMLSRLADRILAVRGNCEAEVDQMVLSFPVMADYCVLPLDKGMIYATHGHVHNLKSPPPLQPGDVLLHGHTHIPAWEDHGAYRYLNPGSVAIPKEGSWHGYMTLENGRFLWKDFDGAIHHELTL